MFRVVFKSILLVLFFLQLSVSQAQMIAAPDEYVNSRISRFLKTTTLIVLEDELNSYYNTVITAAFKDYWKINEFRFIKRNEINAFKNNEKFSFLSFGYFTDDAKVFENLYYGVSFSLVAPLSVNVVSYAFARDSVPVYNQMYKLLALVQMMQEYLQFHQNKIFKVNDKQPAYLIDFYNSRKKELYKKKVYINQDDLNKYFDRENKTSLLTLEGVAKNFRVKPEVVPVDVIAKAVLDQDDKVVFVDGYGKFTNLVTANRGRVISSGKGYIPNNRKAIIKATSFVAFAGVFIILLAGR